MKISELIKKLQHDLDIYGDLNVYYLNVSTKRYVSLEYTSPVKTCGKYDPDTPDLLEVF